MSSIAASTRELTVAVRQLGAIQDRVDSLDEEVARMREAVEAIGGEVVAIRLPRRRRAPHGRGAPPPG